jgi:hypothetical protein
MAVRVTANIIRNIVKGKDTKGCVLLADTLRNGYSMTYGQIWRMVSNVTGISQADWDELLREGETP